MALDVSDSLPDVTVMPKQTITVTMDDANARVTKLNVYALNLETGQVEVIEAVPTVLPYVPQDPP